MAARNPKDMGIMRRLWKSYRANFEKYHGVGTVNH